MGKKDMFKGYGSNTTVVTTGKPLTIKDIQDSLDRLSQREGTDPDILLSPQDYKAFKNAFDPQHQAKCYKFMQYFHKGVKFRHKGSKVCWTVDRTYSHSMTKERVAVVKASSGYQKEIEIQMYNDYEIIYVPEAVKVLFGDK